MQMKHLLVALIVLFALIGTAAAVDEVEIRSQIIHFGDGNSSWTIDASTWAGLYYDLDTGAQTETVKLIKNNTAVDVDYTTKPAFQTYEFNWGNYTSTTGPIDGAYGYAIIGFFAEPYVAVGKTDIYDPAVANAATLVSQGVKANKIAKLVIDDDTKYTLKTGATLEIGSGYTIVADQIDVDGNKVYLKLMKDGKELNSSIVNTNGTTHSTAQSGGDWAFDLTVLNEKNVQVLRVHVKDVFQGTESSLVEIDGVWLIDYLNALEVKTDVDYGKFENKEASATQLRYLAEEVALSADTKTEIGRGIFVRTEKNYTGTHTAGVPTTDKDKLYLYKTYTEPGTYEVRSSVFQYGTAGAQAFNFTNFAAFYYDIDTGVETENMTLTLTGAGGTTVADGTGLVYTTKPQRVNYEYSGWNATAVPDTQYYVMGFFGEKYVPLNIVEDTGVLSTSQAKIEKMTKLIMDDDTKFTLKTGATLELGEGYSLIVDQIDVDGNKAYIKFLKDGKEVNSSIVSARETDSGDWIFRDTVLNEKNSQILRVHVKDVFQGTQDSLVEIEGLWLMDYVNAKEIKTDDKYGVLEYTGSSNAQLNFKNDGEFTMQQDMDKLIAQNMYLKSADNVSLKDYYFYVSMEIGDNGTQPPVDPTPTEPTPTEPEPTPTEPTPTEPVPGPGDNEESWFKKNMWYIIGAVVLIIIIAGAAYYFMVYKKQA